MWNHCLFFPKPTVLYYNFHSSHLIAQNCIIQTFFSVAKYKQKLSTEVEGKLSRNLQQQFGQSKLFPWDSADLEDMRIWFQTKVQEMQRKMQRKMDRMEEKLEKYSRDSRKSRRECRELKQQVSKLELHRTASDPSSCGAIHMIPIGRSVSMPILPRRNSRDSMVSCHHPHPQGTFHSVCQSQESLLLLID